MSPAADSPAHEARAPVGPAWRDPWRSVACGLPLVAAAVLAGAASVHAQASAATAPLTAAAPPPTPSAAAPDQAPAAAAAPGVRLDPRRSARECFDTAQADYFAGHLAEARRGFECAYAQLPSPELLWNLARVSERMGDVEQGVRYFGEYLHAAKLTPRERQGVQRRIEALVALGARQRESSLLKPGPERKAALGAEARMFFERGAKLYRAGHYKAAAAAFTAALQLSDAPELHYNLAVAAERLGESADACDHYRAYLEAVPDAPDRDHVQERILALRSP